MLLVRCSRFEEHDVGPLLDQPAGDRTARGPGADDGEIVRF
jgi:hypothetical protein